MKAPNINCHYYDSFGFCNKRPRTFFGLFKAECVEAKTDQQNFKCVLAKRFPRPILPSPMPKPKKRKEGIMKLVQIEATSTRCPNCIEETIPVKSVPNYRFCKKCNKSWHINYIKGFWNGVTETTKVITNSSAYFVEQRTDSSHKTGVKNGKTL